MSSASPTFVLTPRSRRLLSAGGVLGVVTVIAGALVAPDRLWPAFLMGAYLLATLGLAGAVFIAFEYLAGAAWSVAIRRIPEAMLAVLPFAASALAVLFLFYPGIYSWMHGLHGEHASGFKQAWLSYPFFLARAAAYLAAWILLSWWMARNSRRQDRDGAVAHTFRNRRLAGVFLVVFAVTFWLASFDWIMSLEPEWYSTIFGIYNFAGLFTGGVAVIILLALWMEKAGPLAGVLREDHLHDLGKLLFAFSTFWMYIWFSQYMLIWYANIPEETVYYVGRLRGNWAPLFYLNVALNWAVPFLALLSRPAKRNRSLLAKIAAVVLAGRVLDLYLMIMPASLSQPAWPIWELGVLAGSFALFVYVFATALGRAAPVPLKDPALTESLTYHH